MKEWAGRNAKMIQLLISIASLVVAIVAIIGIKVQIDASSRLQAQQSARDIYREYLNLSISKPEFAEPDYCALKASPQWPAYQNYVDYFLYTSEQVLSVSPDWRPALEEHAAAHQDYLCTIGNTETYAPPVAAMLENFQERQCKAVKPAC